MPNPLSDYGVSDTDWGMAVGMAMGEAMNEGLVGMGVIAATGLNRAQNPGAYLSRSAALGDVFAAPHRASDVVRGRSTPGVDGARQFSPTINSNIRGASTAGHANFRAGLEAALMSAVDPTAAISLGIRQDGFERAKVATEVAVKARDMGIDLGFGTEHFSAPGFERQAGVGADRSRVGGHSLSPTGGWPKGVTPPTPSEFASRFAAAAALTGVAIPDDMVPDITAYTDRAQIMSSASVMQRQAQDYISKELGYDAMPGVNYNDLVQPTGLRAVDVLDVTDQLGIDPVGQQDFANTFGITPDNSYEDISLPDRIGRVDYAGQVAPLDMSQVNPVSFDGRIGVPGTSDFGWSGYGLEGFNAPSMVDQSNFNDRWGAGFPDPVQMAAADFNAIQDTGFPSPAAMSQSTFDAIQSAGFPEASISTGYPEASMDISPVGALGMGEAFGIQSEGWSPSGFSAGVNEGPWGQTPDFGTPSLEARNAMDRFEGAMQVRNTPDVDLTNEAIADRVNVELGPIDVTAPALATAPYSAPATPAVSASLPTPSTAPAFDAQAMAMGDWDDKVGVARDFSTPSLAPATTSAAPSLPASTASVSPKASSAPRSAPQSIAPAPSLPSAVDTPSLPGVDYGGLVDSDFGIGRPGSGFMDSMANPSLASSYGQPVSAFGGLPSVSGILDGLNPFGSSVPDQGFMDAMASPQVAAGWSPGLLDGWTGGALKGAAFGGLTGGPFGALMGGAWGGLNLDGRFGAAFSNQFGGFPGPSWDGYDASTMGYGAGYNDRGERSHSGVDNSGNASVGDGSYGSQSGTNSNNPQGIL
jgi:hypothetical protein